ncbi:hypothetical protein Musp01_23440 [Muricauda sp. NBRC 101325]|nr:hypothetical protein Musp01_23440 [Muricauda sp. NBRC 101325]
MLNEMDFTILLVNFKKFNQLNSHKNHHEQRYLQKHGKRARAAGSGATQL